MKLNISKNVDITLIDEEAIITNLNTINLLTLFLLIYKQYINSR